MPKPPSLKVNVGGIAMKNPVLTASGTFGYGTEFKGLADIKSLGAIVTKTITLHARIGNKPPRVAETPSGMLNSIGLENPGIEKFIKEKLPALLKLRVPVIVSIAGESVSEYKELARRLDKVDDIDGIEINISCPNINTSKLFAQSEESTEEVVKAVREIDSNIHVIIITGHPEFKNIPEIKEIGVDAFFTKPLDVISFMEVLEEIKNKISSSET